MAHAKRTPSLVPKKRKDIAIEETPVKDIHEENDPNDPNDDNSIDEAQNMDKSDKEKGLDKPTSSARIANKENTVDEEQCRVCTTKEDLVSLFKKVDQLTVAEMLMTICPTISIARKDYMPQYICNPCMDNVTIAVQLKTQCEVTEKELRKKLSRSKNKLRRPTGYVVIDAPADSDPPTEEEPNDDVEFKVSDEASISADDDSDDSDFSSKKKRISRSSNMRRRRRKSNVITPIPKTKDKKRSANKRSIENDESSDDDSEQHRRKRMAFGDSFDQSADYPCDQCDQVFTRKLSLVLHKKSHMGGREPIKCEVCGKQFKIPGAYRTHLEKHKDELNGYECDKCEKILTTKADMRRHLTEDHNESGMLYDCRKCKRSFVSENRLSRHQNGRCPGYENKMKKNADFDGFTMGKDLFKMVAPLTTTYWSDSFSD